MAFPLALAVLLAGGGALLLFQPTKKKTTSNPVLVPSEALPPPPGAVGPAQMPGGPPQVIVSPPGTSSTPQQQATQALPNLMQQVQQALPQLFPQSTPAPAPDVHTAAPPGASPAPPAAVEPGGFAGTQASPTPQQVVAQLPQVISNVLTQATHATPSVAVPTPLQSAETAPQIDTYGTIALAKQLIDREASTGWKSDLKPQIQAWQARVGMTADGKLGESGLKRMASEVGVLPLVRYWPSGTLQNTEVPKYRQAINAIADSVQASNPAHAVALRQSAIFENGESYGTENPAPVDPSRRMNQASSISALLTGV